MTLKSLLPVALVSRLDRGPTGRAPVEDGAPAPPETAQEVALVGRRPSTGTVVRVVVTGALAVLALVVVVYLLYLLRQPIVWLIIATFIAVVLSGPVNLLDRWLPRGLAIAVTYVGVLLVPVGLGFIVFPPFVSQITRFVAQIPTYARRIADYVQSSETLRRLDDQYGITQRLQEQAARLPARIGDAAGWLSGLGIGIVNSVFAAVTILILSVFITANGRRWTDHLLTLQPPHRARRVGPTLERVSTAIGAYVGGALVQAAVAGVTTFVVLLVLGVPFPAPLAVLVALLDLIPMVGATIGAVLVGIVTLFADFPTDTIIWALWALVYQQLENNLIQPRIQNRAVGVQPFGVIVAVLFGGTLLGVPGALLAVPIAASLQILVRDWWTWRHRPECGDGRLRRSRRSVTR